MTKRTVLYKAHVSYGADFTDFGGYEMPVRYKDSNIRDEHLAVREGAGMFDVSHMGRYWVYGADAKEYLDMLVPRDVMSLTDGRAGYSFMLNEKGGFRDDVIISQLKEEEYLVVCNAGNRDKIWAWMSDLLAQWKEKGKQLEMVDKSDISCMLAVQGPKAMGIIADIAGSEVPDKRFRLAWVTINGVDVLISTTGYTGENGAELIIVADESTIEGKSIDLWDAMLAKGVKPCALGARDTLRLEAGYCLYGNDIDEETHLLESGLDFRPFAVIDKERGYIGQEAVLAKEDVTRVRVGFRLLVKGIPRHGMEIVVEGQPVGVVTSGTQSPVTKEPIGMAYVPISHKEPGSKFQVDMRGKLKDAEVISFPTYDPTKYGGSRTS
ncbi:MAG: glycine cleavage system aminomethyltransferase GcvT [Candidatus Kariarchaeaceae archaeon]